jgi:hypothetical protein
MECRVARRVRSREVAVSKTDTPWTASGPSHIGIGIQQLAKLNFLKKKEIDSHRSRTQSASWHDLCFEAVYGNGFQHDQQHGHQEL